MSEEEAPNNPSHLDDSGEIVESGGRDAIAQAKSN
jgi:hypothetical protein